MSEDKLAELRSRFEQGDEKALAELFSLHRERLWRTVNFRIDRRLHGRIDPEDVLQEAYLAAAQRIGHYNRACAFSPFVWIRMILSQTLIDLHRRHLGAQMRDLERELSVNGCLYAHTTSESLAIHLVGHLTSPSQKAVRAEMVRMVEEVIADMDPIDQEVLALRHFEELTNSEVAEVLGIQQKAASIRYIRALKRLKEILSRIPGFLEEDQSD